MFVSEEEREAAIERMILFFLGEEDLEETVYTVFLRYTVNNDRERIQRMWHFWQDILDRLWDRALTGAHMMTELPENRRLEAYRILYDEGYGRALLRSMRSVALLYRYMATRVIPLAVCGVERLKECLEEPDWWKERDYVQQWADAFEALWSANVFREQERSEAVSVIGFLIERLFMPFNMVYKNLDLKLCDPPKDEPKEPPKKGFWQKIKGFFHKKR